MSGISRRAFARTRDISEAAVRGHITSGVLADAILPDNTIDAAKADKLLARAITRPKAGKVPILLTTARLRRQRAQARDLQDEVDGWWSTLVNVKHMTQVVSEWNETVSAPIMRRWPAKVAPNVAGQPGAEAQRLLKLGINDLLGELHDAIVKERDSHPDRERKVSPDLDAMTPVQLTAHIENLRAEKLELERWRRIGVPTIDECMVLINESLVMAKSLMLAIPGRAAQLVEHADVAEAGAILSKEMEGAIAAQTPDWSQLEPHR